MIEPNDAIRRICDYRRQLLSVDRYPTRPTPTHTPTPTPTHTPTPTPTLTLTLYCCRRRIPTKLCNYSAEDTQVHVPDLSSHLLCALSADCHLPGKTTPTSLISHTVCVCPLTLFYYLCFSYTDI